MLIMKVKILKKRKKTEKVLQMIRKDSPFIEHVLRWIEHQKKKYEKKDVKLFDICRSRAWQILKELDPDIFNHWLRHQRLSHYAEFMSPYELRARVDFWETIQPVSLTFMDV